MNYVMRGFPRTMPIEECLSDLEPVHGVWLKELSRTEKILVLQSLIQNLLDARTTAHGEEMITEAIAKVSTFTPHLRENLACYDHLMLAGELIDQLKNRGSNQSRG